MSRRKAILFLPFILFGLLTFLLAACKFTQVMESLPPIQPTETFTPAPPTATSAPTETPTPIPTATVSRGTQNPANGHWYLLLNQERSWHTAHEYCRGIGAHLVTISDATENRFVYDISPLTWLGANDKEKEGQWIWITGERLSYFNWAEGQPEYCNAPDCQPWQYLAFSETPYQWVNLPDSEKPFICEWDE